MGWFSKKPTIDPEVVALRRELTDLRFRVGAADQAKTDVEMQLQQLDAATAALSSRLHIIRTAEVELLKRQVSQIEEVNAKIHTLDAMNTQLAELAERVTASSDEARQAKDQTARLDERVSNVSTELANQLGELSREFAEQPDTTKAIDQLQEAQVRLANEQARYEIAFRQDLATVADQLKRGRPDR